MTNFAVNMDGFGVTSQLNQMKNQMDAYKNNIKEFLNGSAEQVGIGSGMDMNTIMNNPAISGDSELMDDIKTLTADNKLVGKISKNMSVDQTGSSADKLINTFSNVLSNSINGVSNSQLDAEKATQIFATGGNIDLHSVMIASEKASLNMQLAMQVRNKLIQAYQEISRLQV